MIDDRIHRLLRSSTVAYCAIFDPHLLGYCPLGQGDVNIPAILDLMNGRKIKGMIMGELDNSGRNPDPVAPVDLVGQSKKYLQSIGVKFRA